MRKVAIYARYSSDLQRERSISDQVAHCEEYARRQGYAVVNRYTDSAKSGASTHGRDGLAQLLADAGENRFDCVVVEALDRLSRDLGDLANVSKKLEFLGITVEATSHGVANDVDIALRGLMGSMFLKDLAHKVRRGQAGVISDGRNAGGAAYGYTPIPGRPGELAIVEEEAEIVRRIYREYVAGATPREIVERLNLDNIRPPRSARHWNASTLNGNSARGHGILRNPLYGGTIVWNRVRMIKNPDTGKRVSRSNPNDEWKFADAPHLRIIDRDLFDAAQALNAKKSRSHSSHARRPKRLLSGLMRCAHCGGGMSIKDRDRNGRLRIHCSTAKESGTCSSRTAVYLDEVEHRVVTGLVSELRCQEALTAFVEAYNEETTKIRVSLRNDVEPLQKQLATIEKELNRVVDLVVKGILEDTEASRSLAKLRQKRKDLEDRIAAWQAPNIVRLNRPGAKVYADTLANLADHIVGEGEASSEALELFRSLVDKVVVRPVAKAKPKLQLHGRLAQLISIQEMAGGIGGSGGPFWSR